MKHAKAAALRAMLPWVAGLAKARSQSEHARQRATCLSQLLAMDNVYKGKGRFLSPAEEQEAACAASAALQAMACLEEMTAQKGPWHLTPKAHALLHIARDSAMANPRIAHCYQDEDFVGRTKRVYSACHGKTAPRRALERYGLGVALQIMAREQLLRGDRRAKARPLDRRAAVQSERAPALPTHGLKRPVGKPPQFGPKRPRGRPRKGEQ